jgi:hypothetical protein
MELEMRAASLSVSLCHGLCLLGGSLETARGVGSNTPLRCHAPDAWSAAVLSRPAGMHCGCKGDGCAAGCLELQGLELRISIARGGIWLISAFLAL